MLQRQLVLAHLRQDGANVQVNIARVADLQAFVDSLLAEVQVVVFDLEGLLEVGERAAELFRPAEHASEVVISNGAVAISFLGQTHSLVEQLEADLEVLFLQEAHGEDVANDGGFTGRSHQL